MDNAWILISILAVFFAASIYALWRESKIPPCCNCKEVCDEGCPCKGKGKCTKCICCYPPYMPVVPF